MNYEGKPLTIPAEAAGPKARTPGMAQNAPQLSELNAHRIFVYRLLMRTALLPFVLVTLPLCAQPGWREPGSSLPCSSIAVCRCPTRSCGSPV
ncbi:MAG: hypothetical protein IPG92_13605 [Flavobacteriales bacterium]|nr:hypothetical protein [Flavobacteriales bacterium]